MSLEEEVEIGVEGDRGRVTIIISDLYTHSEGLIVLAKLLEGNPVLHNAVYMKAGITAADIRKTAQALFEVGE